MSTLSEPAPPKPPPTPSGALTTEPVDWPSNVKSYLEQFILTTLPTTPAFQVLAQKMAYPVGFPRLIMEDLTANTSEYVWTDPVTGLGYLYCNGAAVSQTTYADLYAQWGASKWGADSGGNFLLPDTRGRSLFLCGTNAATDLGDNDGVTESSRQPKHTHTIASITVGNESSHTHGAGSYTNPHKGVDSLVSSSGAGAGMAVGGFTPTTEAITGTSAAGSAHTHALSGNAGSGMSGSDAVAHIVIGSLVVRF